MKKSFLLLLFLPFTLWAETFSEPLDYLQAMLQAHKTKNFEMLYFFKQDDSIESVRYRHANAEDKQYAQLLRLDNAREEIILKDNVVSYFGYDFKPFSLPSTAILDSLPSSFYSEFPALSSYYTFVDGGRTRVADRLARLISVMPRDNFRYKYDLWIDEESQILLKSQLRDHEDHVLEEFHVLQLDLDKDLSHMKEPIDDLPQPIMLTKEAEKSELNWSVKWLPTGFKRIVSEQQRLADVTRNEKIESQLYSDGLFSFSIYLVENKGTAFNERFWRQDKLSIYSQTIGNKDVVVVGEIPLSTAKHIVEEMQFGVTTK